MDLQRKDKFEFQSNSETDSPLMMMMHPMIPYPPYSAQCYDVTEEVNVEGSHSQQLFMMYATANGDGSTTTSVAFAGAACTNIATQFRAKNKPRNIVTNSTQSMFAGTQR